MQNHKTYSVGLGLGIRRAVRLWSRGKPRRLSVLGRRLWAFLRADRRRKIYQAEYGVMVPPVVILSATMRCNLTCTGCYSRDYPQSDELSLEEIDRCLREAEHLGVGFFVITGGEPLLVEGLTDVLSRHPRLLFFFFTNGTLIDREWARRVERLGNIVTLVSVEGSSTQTDRRRGPGIHDRVVRSMRLLNEAGAFFGFSSTVTRENVFTLGGDPFVDSMIRRGCRIGYYIGYVPCGRHAPRDLVPTDSERAWFRNRAVGFQRRKPLLVVHLPDDEYDIGGTCMAAGRGFLHVNAQGYVEPCPFSHMATDSIRDVSLLSAFRSPLFSFIRRRPELRGRPRLGCALYENREKLMAAADGLGAFSTELVSISAHSEPAAAR